MSSPQRHDFMSISDYLHDELNRDTKHEYLDGQIYAMAEASKNHQRIITNMVIRFGQHLHNTPCEPFSSDIKIRIGDIAFFYPDIIVTCNEIYERMINDDVTTFFSGELL